MDYMNSPYGINPYMPQMQALQNAYAQRKPVYSGQVITVSGHNGASAFEMAPNSSVFLMDESGSMVWLAKTDGAGYKSMMPFDLVPHQDAPAPDYSALDARITKLEEAMKNERITVSQPVAAASNSRGYITIPDDE